MADLTHEIARRRTFAIISHPDAGKTTLTEKLLLFGGAIQMAGVVKARGEQRRARSDWLAVERERGISVASSVMSYEYEGQACNLLDTPGHEDFSEDTYRTLTAVDSAVMVIDAARGIQEQTRKLFEVCRLRDMPIITFINKMDREARDPLDLLDEIEQTLQIEVSPVSWPIGAGQLFRGCWDLLEDRLCLVARGSHEEPDPGQVCQGLDDPRLETLLPGDVAAELREQVEMAAALCPRFDRDAFLEGNMTPVYFGSALNNFGVRELLRGIIGFAPPPRPQPAEGREVSPDEDRFSAFVFRIQANMDPRHRDRIAFARVCSGEFRRGMRLRHVRDKRRFAVHNAVTFLARDREVAEQAYPGDIIGLPNHGNLRIGDTLTEGEELQFNGIPSFAPEMLQRVRPVDPMRGKHLGRAVTQLAEEGVARVFRTAIGSNWIVGVIGQLQFDVLADRIRTEYDIPAVFEPAALHTARWIDADDPGLVKRFVESNPGDLAHDHDEMPVFLARNTWHLRHTEENWPGLRLLRTREQSVRAGR